MITEKEIVRQAPNVVSETVEQRLSLQRAEHSMKMLLQQQLEEQQRQLQMGLTTTNASTFSPQLTGVSTG